MVVNISSSIELSSAAINGQEVGKFLPSTEKILFVYFNLLSVIDGD